MADFFDSPPECPMATAPTTTRASTTTMDAAAPYGIVRQREGAPPRRCREALEATADRERSGTTVAGAMPEPAPLAAIGPAAASDSLAASKAASMRSATSAGIETAGSARNVSRTPRRAWRSVVHAAQSATWRRSSTVAASFAESGPATASEAGGMSRSASSASVSRSGCGVFTGGPLGVGSSVVRRCPPRPGSAFADERAAAPTSPGRERTGS